MCYLSRVEWEIKYLTVYLLPAFRTYFSKYAFFNIFSYDNHIEDKSN